ncbi:MAG: HAMP domain-containing protein [Patescibacteria group bacterium]
MKTSIFSRIFGAIVLVSFIAVTLVSTLSLLGQVQVFEDSVIREKTTLLNFLQTAARQKEENDFLSNSILRNVENSGDISFFWIVDDEGRVVRSAQNELKGEKIDDPFVGSADFNQRTVQYKGRRVEVIAQPLEGVDGERWTAILGVNMAEVTAFLIPAFARASLILLFAILLSIFLSLALTEKIISPLLDLRRAIEKITNGNLNQNIEIKTGDEIEEIGREFNEMTQRLKENRQELEEAKKVLEIRVRARTKELEELIDTLEEKVEARTQELQRKVEELEKFHKLTVGREKKMIQLKEENEELKEKIENLEEEIKKYKN